MPFCCNSITGNCVELTDREYEVCNDICTNSTPVSFSELKRNSELHQEVLSRILRRLAVHRVIEKLKDGKYAGFSGSQ